MDGTHRLNLSAGIASVAAALFLVAIKLWALAATGALSVGASLADSALDLLASAAGLLGILYAAKPPDADHRSATPRSRTSSRSARRCSWRSPPA